MAFVPLLASPAYDDLKSPAPAPGASSASPALAHLLTVTTRSATKWWLLSALGSAVTVIFSELHSWQSLSTRTITTCHPLNGTVIPGNATGLAACAALGLFECAAATDGGGGGGGVGSGGSGALTVVTSPPPLWTGGMYTYMLAVAFFWASVMWELSCQNKRAAVLLPRGIYVTVKAANGAFLLFVLALTAGYCALKAATFTAMDSSVTFDKCGAAGIVAVLSPVLLGSSSGSGTGTASGGGGGTNSSNNSNGLWALLNSTLLLLLSFQGLYTVASRYASDAYADVSLAAMLTCPGPAVTATAAVTAALTATATATSSGKAGAAACELHASYDAPAAAGDTVIGHSAVTAALCMPLLAVDSRRVDAGLQHWFAARQLAAAGHKWKEARYLRKCDADTVADAIAYLHAWLAANASGSASGTSTGGGTGGAAVAAAVATGSASGSGASSTAQRGGV